MHAYKPENPTMHGPGYTVECIGTEEGLLIREPRGNVHGLKIG